MDLQQKLKEQGWHITNDGLSKLAADVDKSDTRKVVQSLLDIDLRDVGAGALPAEISRKEESIPGRIVLQIVKIRNISAPKSNEESKTAPRFLYVEFTDGAVQIFGLEFEHISSISLNTPPGTKVFMRAEKIPLMQGILVLRPSDVQVLGGEVAALVEKWELTRTLQKYARGGRINTGSSGPPPWIPFGQKIQQFNDDKNFKSLAAGNGPEKEKDAKENEFDAMRNEAIAEAAKSGAKKIFGGGNQQMLDHNVKKIIEKGFSEIDAKNALRATRNNLERALYNLKRRDDVRERPDNKEVARGPPKRGTFKETKKLGGKEDQIAAPTKPAGNVSLFDFLTDKLPANSETTTPSTETTNTTSSTNKFDRPPNKFDSSRPGNTSSSQQHQSGGYQSQSSIPGNQQASSAVSSSQQQSSRPTKFENNISSSFANRNTTNSFDGSDFSSYRNRNRMDRNDRNERSSRGGGSSSYSMRQPSEMGRGGGHSSQRSSMRPSQERERGSNYQQSAMNADYRDNRMDAQRGGSENRSYKTPSGATRYSNKPNYSNNFPQNNSNNNRNYSDSRNTPHSDQQDSEKVKDLIEDVARMKLESKPSTRGGGANRMQRNHPNSQHQNNQKQSQQQSAAHQQNVQVTSQSQQQLQQQHAVYTPLPNGFAYDPNKILGFQNKESNEYAMSMLKSQSLPPAGSTMPTPPPNAHAQYSQGAPPMQMAPQQSFHPAPPQFLMQAPPTVRTFGIPAMDGGFNWKIGDRCLAKYWEDGRYYEAEITGLSDETCVVLFLGYGNYEEVLKPDCLPINSNHPIVQHHHQAGVPPQQLQHQLHQQNNARAGTTAGVASTGRYRGERQMYVPPPKREA